MSATGTLGQRYPPGTATSNDESEDPMQGRPQPPSASELSGLQGDTQKYMDRAYDFPDPPNQSTYAAPKAVNNRVKSPANNMLAAHGLSELEAEDMAARGRGESEDLSATARMSPAEHYALQARMHTQQQEQRGINGLPLNDRARAAAKAEKRKSAGTVTSHAHNNSNSTGENNDSLGSPFRHRASSLPPEHERSTATQQNAMPQSASRAERSRPPVSGSATRPRRALSNASLGASESSGSLTKDGLINLLAEGLQRERAKVQAYMKELVEAESEVSFCPFAQQLPELMWWPADRLAFSIAGQSESRDRQLSFKALGFGIFPPSRA